MKKFAKYIGSIFGTYGALTPLIVVSLVFVLLVSMDRNDAVTGLILNHKGWFIFLAIVAVLALVFGVVMFFKNFKSENVGVGDLFLLILTVLAFLVLILFCFLPGAKGSWLSILKWTVVSVGFVCFLVADFVRSRFVR